MDVLEDLRNRLTAIGFNDPKIEKVIMDIESDWQCQYSYIKRRCIDSLIAERNRAIIRAYKNGESARLISRRYDISVRMVYKIING